MAFQTVRDVLGDMPRMEFEIDSAAALDTSKIWANYDEESDSFILYITGKPQRGVKVLVDDDTYVIVDRSTRKVIGLYFENWERSYIPAHQDIGALWQGVQVPSVLDSAWITFMRMIALWIVVSMSGHSKDQRPRLQPA